jgi:hypothetical protein
MGRFESMPEIDHIFSPQTVFFVTSSNDFGCQQFGDQFHGQQQTRLRLDARAKRIADRLGNANWTLVNSPLFRSDFK